MSDDLISAEMPVPAANALEPPPTKANAFRELLDALDRAPARLSLNQPNAEQALVQMASHVIEQSRANAAALTELISRTSPPARDTAAESASHH